MLALPEPTRLFLAFLRYSQLELEALISTLASWAEKHNFWGLADVDAPAEVRVGALVGASRGAPL